MICSRDHALQDFSPDLTSNSSAWLLSNSYCCHADKSLPAIWHRFGPFACNTKIRLEILDTWINLNLHHLHRHTKQQHYRLSGLSCIFFFFCKIWGWKLSFIIGLLSQAASCSFFLDEAFLAQFSAVSLSRTCWCCKVFTPSHPKGCVHR